AGLPVETIGSRFGALASGLPTPVVPRLDLQTIRHLIQPALAIALLGGIESLLSAVVSDGMIGGNHKSNTELIAQGAANMASALFGGIPATGAIARTATNVKNGGRTPVAGIIHSLTLLVILILVGKWAALIPMATLAGILVVVAYNMSEWESFVSILKGPRSDAMVLITTFLLTVLVDLTAAIEVGMVLATFLFMRQMIRFSEVSSQALPQLANGAAKNASALTGRLPEGIEVFQVTGPLFFGAAHKFKDAIKFIEKKPKVLIIRMGQVPIIDATGIRTIAEVYKEYHHMGTRLILSEVHSEQVLEELKDARLIFAIGKANITTNFDEAIERSKVLLQEFKKA
ncbi:MAG: SulP family inorganic anion transporter, partial [Bacteroidetes bacterium]|nr:SulP family inorganic anion transporter [Bacteroidota bacterium]